MAARTQLTLITFIDTNKFAILYITNFQTNADCPIPVLHIINIKAQPLLEEDCFRRYYVRPIITDSRGAINRHKIIVLNKTANKVSLLYVACPNNINLLVKHQEKQCDMRIVLK